MKPSDKKWLLAGCGLVAAIVLYKKFAPDNGGSKKDPTSGVPEGYVFNATTVATKLYDAMKEMETDEEAIIKALQPVSKSQFDQVIAKFGKRSYNATLGNQYNFNPFSSLPLQPLAFWLKNELSTSRYNFLALKFPQL